MSDDDFGGFDSFDSSSASVSDDLGFDVFDYAAASFDVIPNGTVLDVVITSAEIKATKAGDGRRVAATLEVVGDKYTGRKLFHSFNIDNPNPKAEEIGRGELRAAAEAVGLSKLGNPRELCDKPLKVRVKVSKSRDGADENRIGSWLKS